VSLSSKSLSLGVQLECPQHKPLAKSPHYLVQIFVLILSRDILNVLLCQLSLAITAHLPSQHIYNPY
jgi:hypothetical protein